jgi:hypothetical protein
MFYELEYPDPFLRMGDIINGFQFIRPDFELLFDDPQSFSLIIEKVEHFVVLTPCCSIEEKKISIVPLRKLPSKLFLNPNFTADFTVLNRPMSPELQLPPDRWDALPEEVKQRKIGEGINYFFQNYYIFHEHDLLPRYHISYKENKFETGFYLIDFKDTYSIQAKNIEREANLPKVLQLSKAARQDLRDKISNYYFRIPEEDKVC